ncbi:MAG TPA: hypothetical protein VGD60_05525 [Candidatus Acidoferrales bacterium]
MGFARDDNCESKPKVKGCPAEAGRHRWRRGVLGGASRLGRLGGGLGLAKSGGEPPHSKVGLAQLAFADAARWFVLWAARFAAARVRRFALRGLGLR